MNGYYASKLREVYNNNALSNQALRESYYEYNLSKSLNHPNIIKYLHFVKSTKESTDQYHIIMELIKGKNLSTFIHKNGAVSNIRTIQDICRQILNGLDYLHTKNIAHLDIKPSNIMLTENETIKLIDLGISM